MSITSRPVTDAPAGVSARARARALAVILIATALAGFLIGRTSSPSWPPGASLIREGVPVGGLDTPAGALVAADDDLLIGQETIESAPKRYAVFVREAFAAQVQEGALAQAAGVRSSDPAGMALWAAGGRSLSVVGAHRLDAYRGDEARVSLWVGTVYWGPRQSPKQAWSLAQVTLRWNGHQWRVIGLATSSGAPAPVPALTPQANPANDSARAFDAALAGFAPVSSGAPQQ